MNRRNLVAACFSFFVLLALWPSAGHGGNQDYVYYFHMERPGGYAWDVYVYEGTHEEVYGSLEDCGPMQESCDDTNNWSQYTCGILQDLYKDGFKEEVRISAGSPDGKLAYFFAHYDPNENTSVCNAARGDGWISDYRLVDPLDVEAYWVLAVDASDFEQAESVKIEQDGVEHTAEFVYGTFNDVFTPDESSCGVNLSDICAKGAQQANNFADSIIGALWNNLGVNADGSSDRFYIPYATAGANIKVKFDKFDIPQSDECCDVDTVSRDKPVWWVRFTPRPGGNGSPTCSHRDSFRTTGDSRSFDPLNEHSFPEGDGQFTSAYAQYPQGEDEPFPKPDHSCSGSDYQGTVGLKSDSGSDKREHYTYLASNPLIVDLADYDTPQAMLSALGGLQGTYTRHLKIVHSHFDGKQGLPPVKLHYKLDRLEELYNDNDGFDKYWYLDTTPPGSNTWTELPRRNGTDEIIENVSSDPDYCYQRDHACKQNPFNQSKDHAFVIQPGKSALYLWQLAEADDARPDAQYSIADARDEWYAGGANDFNPATDAEWFLLTDVTGILFTYSFHNEDDLLAASKFEITHGAAYTLARDFQYDTQNQPLSLCRTAMKQEDERVQKIYSGSSSGCGSDKKTWILPVSKHDTRGTVFTNVWVEVME